MKKRSSIGKWKKVFKGKFFEVLHAEITLPSGKKEIFERAIRPSTVAILAFDEKRNILLTREYRAKQQKYEWRIPSGKVDNKENVKVAAQREFREETGFRAKKLIQFSMSDGSAILDWKRYSFLASGLSEDPLPGEEDEDITVIPTSTVEAYKMVVSGEIENEWIGYLIARVYWDKEKVFKKLGI